LSRYLVRLSLCLALWQLPQQAIAQTPFPPYTGDVLTVAGVENTFDEVRPALEMLNRESKQKYYAVVIRNCGPGKGASIDYVDRLYLDWQSQANRKGQPLDPDRSVLILLAVENRLLAVHPGGELQGEYGLQGPTIDRELVQRYFVPQAKAGNPGRGLVRLAQEIDKWLAAKDAAKAAESQAKIARTAELKRTAEKSLEGANRLAAEVRQELAARQTAGFALDTQSETLRIAEEKLAGAVDLPARNPQALLALTQSIEKELLGVQKELRQLLAIQHDAVQQLEKNEAALLLAEKSVEERSHADLAVGPAQAQLEEARQQNLAARGKLASDPRQALALADQASAGIKRAKDEAEELPKLRGELNTWSEKAEAEALRVEALLASAKQAGVRMPDEEEKFQAFQSQLAKTRETQAENYRSAIAAYTSTTEKLQAQARRVDVARSSRLFTTRTLPFSAFGLLAACGAGAFGWKLRGYLALKHRAEAELAKFQAEGVDLLEKLDALKKRHQMLPFSDRDFSEPMAGATLASYQACETALDKVRESWLTIMDVRRQVEGLVELEKFLGTENYQKALEIMAATPQAVGADEQYQQIVAHLDLLENAHEQAEPLLKSVDAAREHRAAQLEELRTAGLMTAPYEPELAVCSEMAEAARKILKADPIDAKKILNDAAARDAALAQRVGNVLARWPESQGALARLQEVSQRARSQRSEGLLLTEDEANPDSFLSRSEKAHAAAVEALQQGDAELAASQIAESLRESGEAASRIDAQLAARQFVSEAIPARRIDTARLSEQLGLAQAAREELERDFAEPSWHDVAQNVAQARALTQAGVSRADHAESLAAAPTQRYLAAAELLKQAAADQQQANSLTAAILARRKDLDDLRSRSRQEQNRLTELAARMRSSRASHERIVSAEADRLLVSAERLIDGLRDQLRAAQPHWPAIAEQQQQASAGLQASEERAQRDIKSHTDLTQRLPIVGQQGQRVNELLRSSTADRARANERYHSAAIVLARIAEQARGAKAEWVTLLKQLADTAADFEKADAWAREDIRLAQQARDALVEAEREVQRAKTFYRSGISADTSVAQSQLAQSAREQAAQDYEQAITLAGSAMRAARDAHNDAIREAQNREERLEAERRRRLQEQALAAALLASQARPSYGASTFGGSSRSSGGWSSSGSSSPSSSSSSSYSSGSSESSW